MTGCLIEAFDITQLILGKYIVLANGQRAVGFGQGY